MKPVLLVLMFLAVFCACGPGPVDRSSESGSTVTWSRTFGGSGYELAHPVRQTSDGGFLVGGGSGSTESGIYEAWLVRTDAGGNEVWNRFYGSGRGGEVRDLDLSTAGGCILTGVDYASEQGAGDVWLCRVAEEGEELWSRNFGVPLLYDIGNAVRAGRDGGFLVAGMRFAFSLGGDAFLLETDGGGGGRWVRSYGGLRRDTVYAIRETADRGWVLAGQSWSAGEGDADFWLLRTDGEGRELWNRTYGGEAGEGAHGLQVTGDGGFILAGATESFGAGMLDGWLVKTDDQGNEQWSRTFGGDGDDLLFFVCRAGEGYVASGATYSFGAGKGDVWLLKTDGLGNEEWSRTFGGPEKDESYWMDVTADGGFVLSGLTESFGAGQGDFWLIKTDALGRAPASPSQSP